MVGLGVEHDETEYVRDSRSYFVKVLDVEKCGNFFTKELIMLESSF